MKGLMQYGMILLGLAILLVIPMFRAQTVAQDTSTTEEKSIIYFYGQGCPHCANVDEFLSSNNHYDNYMIEKKEIYFDRDNAASFNDLMSAFGVSARDRGIPTMVFGEKFITGDGPIIDNFAREAEAYLSGTQIIEEPVSQESSVDNEENDKVSIPLIVGASLVDAINPCAFAVLIILLSTVLAKKNRKQALMSGLSFSASIFISYILMGLGVYAALGSLGSTNVLTTIVGVLAIILGLMNLKDFFWYGKAFLVEVPRSWRPNMKKLIGTVTSPGGAFLIGFLVSLFLLPCTSGPYLVVLGLLAENTFDITAMLYLVLYNVIFVSPMVVITLLVYKGGDVEKIEYFRQANLERLHLIAGLILIGLGLFILL